MQTILIADDEPDIREIVSFNLSKAGYRCLTAVDGRQALEVLALERADLLLLDVMMPELSGFDVARTIRNDEVDGVPYDLPIIFLTALGEEDDVLRGFALGADDYIAKPFSLRLLLARVEAVLKRSQDQQPLSPGSAVPFPQTASLRAREVCYETLTLDEDRFSAAIDGADLGLTKMEYELLHFLLTHAGVVYSRSEILGQVWPDNGLVLDRTVDVTVTRLRKKLADYKDRIKTKAGYGYYWEK